MDVVINVQGLVKSFGRTRALDGLDLQVQPGEVHGFLGPNGAGKSTTLRVLLGLLHTDAGEVVVLGGHPVRDAVALHRRIAHVPGDATLWPNLTGGEIIDLVGGIRGGIDVRLRDELIERFELDPRKKASAYSTGNRQKVLLIPALASDAELLIMDEPTSGLDPLMAGVFQDCIRDARDAGRTVLLSSHVLAEVESLADRVTIIRAGRKVESGTLDELRHLTRTSVRVQVDRSLQGLGDLPGVHDLDVTDGHASFGVDTDHLDGAIRFLSERGIRALVTQPPTLEELFLRHYAASSEPAPMVAEGRS